MVIVTRNHYVLASKIYHVTLDEEIDHINIKKNNGEYRSVPICRYTINICYEPETATSGIKRDMAECTIHLSNKCDAHAVYRDLVKQIREQMPDQLYMDTAIDRLLNQYPIEKIEEFTESKTILMSRKKYDRKSKKVRSARKKKRRN